MKNERSKRGAILMLWTVAVLGLPGCDQGGTTDTGAGGSTGMDGSGTTAAEETGGPATGTTAMTTADSGSDGTPPAELSCDAYCEIYLDACQDFSEYANVQDCVDNCGQWPEGTPADVAGDTLGCRTYHATVAGSTDASLHCPHAGPSGAMTCTDPQGPTCELYCTRYFNNCDADLNLYVDKDDCRAQCAPWYPGSVTDDAGDSIGCRAYYANLAAGDPAMFCPNAGPGGGDACVL